MNITANFTEATGLFTRHGFVVTPALLDGDAQYEAEQTIINDYGVVGEVVQCDWNTEGTEVEIVTEYDSENYWTD